MSRPDDAVGTGGRSSLYGTSASPEEQRKALARGDVTVAVHGLRETGVRAATELAELTGTVTGVDPDPDAVERIQRADSVAAGRTSLSSLVAELVEMNALGARTDPVPAAVHVVTVPPGRSSTTGDSREAIRGNGRDGLRETIARVGSVLRGGDLVVVESVVPPGTTAGLVAPTLADESGLDPGTFGVATAPPRIRAGRTDERPPDDGPRIVGGTDAESTRAAALVYQARVDGAVVTAPDAGAVECARLIEDGYREVTVALANEFVRQSDDLGVDVREAIALANTNPAIDVPDPGLAVDAVTTSDAPLASGKDREGRLVSTARSINSVMPAHVVRKLTERLAIGGREIGDASVCLLGLTTRPNAMEVGDSPARDVAAILSALGATVYGVDPHVDDADGFDLELASTGALPELARKVDALVVLSPHREFGRIDWDGVSRTLVFDASGVVELDDASHDVYTLGSGDR